MQTFFQDNKSDELILLFNGWGMDEKPFTPLISFRDILFVSDYSDCQNFNFNFDFSKYKKIFLITFSAGVYMAAYLQDKLPKLDMKIAVNGTLKLFNQNLGLTQQNVNMMASVSEKNYMELRKKLFYNKKYLAVFNKYQPARDITSSLNELAALKKYYLKDLKFDYDKVILGQNDLIIPYANQFRAWQNHKNKRILQGGHFLFYLFKSFDEIINY